MAGVAEWVCCPGELNAPLYRALADCPVVHRWSQSDERTAARRVLTAAAMTYVAALAVSLMQLLRLVLIFGRRRD